MSCEFGPNGLSNTANGSVSKLGTRPGLRLPVLEKLAAEIAAATLPRIPYLSNWRRVTYLLLEPSFCSLNFLFLPSYNVSICDGEKLDDADIDDNHANRKHDSILVRWYAYVCDCATNTCRVSVENLR